ncbi:PRAME family member 12-like [Eptesicus fuscus]|uniref:PRAME family member 12-like n=1 Tax=Eptesicus fuscus TaxID=29078 RepID=UPI0024042ACB|nr:PRAME family member 12-like [Eptesicus fuscus]
MSIRTPPTLLQLAGESLLRDQALAIAALEHLPAELFPQLFNLACYSRRHQESLKAMAQAWPYPVLPLGILMKRPRVKVLKAVLDGLDVLLAQEVRPRRWKLRVLDLRDTGAKFWRMWCGDSTLKRSPTGPVTVHRSSPNMEHPLAPVEVFLDLNFNDRDRDEFFMYVIQWAQQREGLLHLCCKTLRIAEVPFQRVRKVLDAVQLDCIQEMLRPQHLRELDLDSPSFLRGRLDQMLRCLQTPLEKLTITHFRHLTHSDLTHLFQCPNLRQLVSLRLYCTSLADFSPEPLRALLEAVAPTLQELRLDKCAMVDSHVEAILPVLSGCHQLSEFTITENRLSMATVGKLLRHTAGLRSLEVELYPVPLECYRTHDTVNQERFALIRSELTGILRELGQPRNILLSTKHSGHREFYDVAFS